MATTTTNFGFDIPQSSDYVKNGATAIAELGQDIDTRFGNVATYPNQIVNVVSGVSRPLPYAVSAGRVTISGTSVPTGGNVNATVTYTTSTRFTVAPVVTVAQTSLPGGSALLIPKILQSNTTGFTTYFYNAAATAQTFSNAEISYISMQMTSASATNS